ncbi:MAG: helix-turn-helix transcriptional regulator [Xenococcaceae cyanobacterium MO_234.B1]|nr:helix-turn-helix transcriptional regulator [Xenococcaceae cyanobacterium MO_234.B1]
MANEYIKIFNILLERREYRYSLKELSDLSGLGVSQLSRFLNGKTDLPVSKFFHLVNSMPLQFQKDYWSELNVQEIQSKKKNWRVLISTASPGDIEEILRALSDRYSELKDNNEALSDEMIALSA